MTVLMNEEIGMDAPVKTYLQIYKEHIRGYKEYKMMKASPAMNVMAEFGDEVPAALSNSISAETFENESPLT